MQTWSVGSAEKHTDQHVPRDEACTRDKRQQSLKPSLAVAKAASLLAFNFPPVPTAPVNPSSGGVLSVTNS